MYLVAWYLLRNIDDMSTWVENFLNLEYDQPTEADKSWHRLWANILGGGGVLLSVYAMMASEESRGAAGRVRGMSREVFSTSTSSTSAGSPWKSPRERKTTDRKSVV